MLTQSQHQELQMGIGASECAAILGIDPYCTPYELFLIKTGRMTRDLSNNEAVIMGSLLEPVVARRYAQLTQQKVCRANKAYHHKDYPHIICHLDRKIIGKRKSVEIKTANPYANGWGEAGTDEVPARYIAQVQQQLAVTGFEESDLIVFRGTTDLRIYNFRPDPQLIHIITKKVNEFWNYNIAKDIAPEPTTRGDYKILYPDNNGSLIEMNDEMMNLMGRLKEVKSEIKSLEQEKDVIEKNIIGFIRNHDGIKQGDEVIATFKSNKNGVRALRVKGS
jgi:putative phage-type endonuclease